MIRRQRLRGAVLYALTTGAGKGVQVVDLTVARERFDAVLAVGGEASTEYWRMLTLLGTTGQSFGQEAIVQTVFLDNGDRPDVDDDGSGRDGPDGGRPRAADRAGDGAQPARDRESADRASALQWRDRDGGRHGADRVGLRDRHDDDRQRAGGARVGDAGRQYGDEHRFVVIDVRDPRAPVATGYVDRPGFAGGAQDLVVRGTRAYVGTTTGTYLIELSDLAPPQWVGSVAGVGGRLGFSDDNLLFGAVRGLGAVAPELAGMRSAALSAATVITTIHPEPIVVSAGAEVFQDTDFTYKFLALQVTERAEVRIDVACGGRVATVDAPGGRRAARCGGRRAREASESVHQLATAAIPERPSLSLTPARARRMGRHPLHSAQVLGGRSIPLDSLASGCEPR
jgi:hypothetical protein